MRNKNTHVKQKKLSDDRDGGQLKKRRKPAIKQDELFFTRLNQQR